MIGIPETEEEEKVDCSFDIIGMSVFAGSFAELRLESGPPNKTVSRELSGRRRDMKFESRQRTLAMLKQAIVVESEGTVSLYYYGPRHRIFVL